MGERQRQAYEQVQAYTGDHYQQQLDAKATQLKIIEASYSEEIRQKDADLTRISTGKIEAERRASEESQKRLTADRENGVLKLTLNEHDIRGQIKAQQELIGELDKKIQKLFGLEKVIGGVITAGILIASLAFLYFRQDLWPLIRSNVEMIVLILGLFLGGTTIPALLFFCFRSLIGHVWTSDAKKQLSQQRHESEERLDTLKIELKRVQSEINEFKRVA